VGFEAVGERAMAEGEEDMENNSEKMYPPM